MLFTWPMKQLRLKRTSSLSLKLEVIMCPTCVERIVYYSNFVHKIFHFENAVTLKTGLGIRYIHLYSP